MSLVGELGVKTLVGKLHTGLPPTPTRAIGLPCYLKFPSLIMLALLYFPEVETRQ